MVDVGAFVEKGFDAAESIERYRVEEWSATVLVETVYRRAVLRQRLDALGVTFRRRAVHR